MRLLWDSRDLSLSLRNPQDDLVDFVLDFVAFGGPHANPYQERRQVGL